MSQLTITDMQSTSRRMVVQIRGKQIKLEKECLVWVTARGKSRKTTASDMKIGEDLVVYNCKKI